MIHTTSVLMMILVTVVSPTVQRNTAIVTGGEGLVEVSVTAQTATIVMVILMDKRIQIQDRGREQNMRSDLFIFF